jgi:TGS domain
MLRRVLRACTLHFVAGASDPRADSVKLTGLSFHRCLAMGGDCCGVETGVQSLTVEDINGVTQSTTTKSHADFVQERIPFYKKRIDLFEQYWQRQQKQIEDAKAADVKIKVVLPDGNQKEAVKGATTPMDIAKEISTGLAKKVVVASVDGSKWDINRPLTGDCALQLFSPNDPEGLDVRPDQLIASSRFFPSLLPSVCEFLCMCALVKCLRHPDASVRDWGCRRCRRSGTPQPTSWARSSNRRTVWI